MMVFQTIMKSKVRFSEDTKVEALDGSYLDPEIADKLYRDGGFLILKDLPEGTEFGIDMQSWNTGGYNILGTFKIQYTFLRPQVSWCENDTSWSSFCLL